MKLDRSNIKTFAILALIIFLAVAVTLLVLAKGKNDALQESLAGKSLQVEEASAQYTDISGNPVNLDKYLGQNLIVHSWASWCPQCVDQLKMFSSVISTLENTKLIAINRGEDRVTAEGFLNHYELWSDVELIIDPTDHFYKTIEGYAMPETVIFDKNGSIVAHFRGVVSETDIKTALANLESN